MSHPGPTADAGIYENPGLYANNVMVSPFISPPCPLSHVALPHETICLGYFTAISEYLSPSSPLEHI